MVEDNVGHARFLRTILEQLPGAVEIHQAGRVDAGIARLEAKIAMQLLVKQMPKLRLLGPGKRIHTWLYWGREALPVAWD